MSHQLCTEIAVLPLISGVRVTDKDSEAGKVLQEVLAILAPQPGFQGAFYGHQVEDGEKMTIALGETMTLRMTSPCYPANRLEN
jgi:hypothetical protein